MNTITHTSESLSIMTDRELDHYVFTEVIGWTLEDASEEEGGCCYVSPSRSNAVDGPPNYAASGDGILAITKRMIELGMNYCHMSVYEEFCDAWFIYNSIEDDGIEVDCDTENVEARDTSSRRCYCRDPRMPKNPYWPL